MHSWTREQLRSRSGGGSTRTGLSVPGEAQRFGRDSGSARREIHGPRNSSEVSPAEDQCREDCTAWEQLRGFQAEALPRRGCGAKSTNPAAQAQEQSAPRTQPKIWGPLGTGESRRAQDSKETLAQG